MPDQRSIPPFTIPPGHSNLMPHISDTKSNHTLKFRDIPTGTRFKHPFSGLIYRKVELSLYDPQGKRYTRNALSVDPETVPQYTLIADDVLVELLTSQDFYSVPYGAFFAHDGNIYTKTRRNMAKVAYSTDVQHFEPDDTVSIIEEAD